MIRVRLREQMEAFERRTGEAMSYERLADMTGLSRSTLESLGSRAGYNATLATVDAVCLALGCGPGDLLVQSSDR